jgi:phosphoribosyl 1,2-cyclic phosphodiesterase
MQEFAADVRYRDLTEGRYTVDDLEVETLLLKHPGHCLGYRVNCNGQNVCYVSDNELYPRDSRYYDAEFHQRLVQFIQGAKFVIADATYRDEEYAPKMHWGHSPVSEVAAIAHEAGVQTLFLYHHDPDQRDDQIDAKLEAAKKKLEALGSKTVVEAPAEGASYRF